MAVICTNFSLKALLAVGLGIGISAACCGEEAKAPELADTTQTLVEENVRVAINNKDWDAAIRGIDSILPKVPRDSYDESYLDLMKAQFCFQKEKTDYHGALVAIERVLAICEKHPNFLQGNQKQEILWNATQINFQEGAANKDLKQQAVQYARADQELNEWLRDAKTFTPEQLYFISVLYFSRGQPEEGAGTNQKVDRPMMEKALYWTDRGLRASARPRDTFYQLRLAELYQLERYEDTAECLELLVKMKPDNKSYWQQLASTYLQLASAATEKHDDRASFSYNLRTILTIERAQKLGIMNTPKDNYNLVGIYFNIGEFADACALLERGLKDASIERTQANFELLANSYQQLHQESKSVATLMEAAKVFPHSGQIENEIAVVYQSVDDSKDAFEHVKACIAKGGTDKPYKDWLFYAYLALDLKRYDDALKGAAEAAKYPEAAKEAAQMKEAINATLLDLESRRKSQ
ncbi:MAG TPA: hypothetical protein VLW52_08520 [Opitutaceae bacterium]|nr:hypothetical protein [Opitutaceae bacterium]